VRPAITLDRVGGFTARRRVEPVTDEAVLEQLQQLREARAAWIPVEGDKPAPGTMVRVEVATVEEGEAREPQSYTIVIGQGQTVPALEERIMELLPGETADTEIRYPDDHPDPARRGLARTVRVTLQEVKRQELPELDDAFAKEVGDFNDLAALRVAVRADLEAAATREADRGVREELLQQVIEANSVTAPPSLVQRALHAYLHAYQVPHEREEQFYNEFRPIAVSQVKRELALTALADRESLHATEAEVDARVARIAAQRKVPVAELYASLEKNKRLGEIERAVTEEKVFEFLLSQSQVEESQP
jgi:trigger factor